MRAFSNKDFLGQYKVPLHYQREFDSPLHPACPTLIHQARWSHCSWIVQSLNGHIFPSLTHHAFIWIIPNEWKKHFYYEHIYVTCHVKLSSKIFQLLLNWLFKRIIMHNIHNIYFIIPSSIHTIFSLFLFLVNNTATVWMPRWMVNLGVWRDGTRIQMVCTVLKLNFSIVWVELSWHRTSKRRDSGVMVVLY